MTAIFATAAALVAIAVNLVLYALVGSDEQYYRNEEAKSKKEKDAKAEEDKKKAEATRVFNTRAKIYDEDFTAAQILALKIDAVRRGLNPDVEDDDDESLRDTGAVPTNPRLGENMGVLGDWAR